MLRLFGLRLQEISCDGRASVTSWILPTGFMSASRWHSHQQDVKQQPIEKLQRTYAAWRPTGIREEVVFSSGDTGQRCAHPARSRIFQRWRSWQEYGWDWSSGGGERRRAMGADIVIAVNISNLPANNETKSMLDVLMQTFDIMSCSINRYELRLRCSDQPYREIDQTNLDDKHWAYSRRESGHCSTPADQDADRIFGDK